MTGFRMGGVWTWQVFDADGTRLRGGIFYNMVPTAALTDVLSVYLGSGVQKTSWFIGLIDNASFSALAASDTSAAHSGWAESSAYSESVRQTISFGSAAGGLIASSASLSFTANATVTIKGAFVISNSTKGGSTGLLFATGAFDSTQSLVSGQILKIDYDCGASSS